MNIFTKRKDCFDNMISFERGNTIFGNEFQKGVDLHEKEKKKALSPCAYPS